MKTIKWLCYYKIFNF